MNENFSNRHLDWITVAAKVLDSGCCIVTLWGSKSPDEASTIRWLMAPSDNFAATREDILTVVDASLDSLFHRVGYGQATLF